MQGGIIHWELYIKFFFLTFGLMLLLTEIDKLSADACVNLIATLVCVHQATQLFGISSPPQTALIEGLSANY